MKAPALVALCAFVPGTPLAAADSQLTTLVYLCDKARVLSLVQPGPAVPGQQVDVTFGAETRRMQPAIAASGARYVSVDGAWQWWGKGSTGRLTAADGTVLAGNCSLLPPTGQAPRPAVQ